MTNILNQRNGLLKTFIWEVLIVSGIIVAYATSRYLMLPLLIVACIYIICIDSDDKSTAMLIALFMFSGIFKISSGTTSLFFICKVAYLFRALAKGYLRYVNKSVIFETVLIILCAMNMLFFGTDAIIRIINLFLWMLVAYVMLFCMTNDIYQIGLFFIVSFFFSCVVSLATNFLPTLAAEVKNIDIYYDPGYGADISRYTGIFGDPNMTTVVIITCLFILLKIYQGKKIDSFLFLCCALVLSVLGIMTGSKSCFLLLLVYWSVYFFTKLSNKVLKTLLIITAIIIVLSFSTTNLYDYYMYRFFGAASGVTTGRTDIWFTYFDRLNIGGKKNWFLGFGINTPDLPNGRAAHNVFIQIIYNIGIIGLISYISFWISIILEYIKPYKRTRLIKILNWAPLACVIATSVFLDAFFIEAYYFTLPLAIMLIAPVNYEENQIVGEVYNE